MASQTCELIKIPPKTTWLIKQRRRRFQQMRASPASEGFIHSHLQEKVGRVTNLWLVVNIHRISRWFEFFKLALELWVVSQVDHAGQSF